MRAIYTSCSFSAGEEGRLMDDRESKPPPNCTPPLLREVRIAALRARNAIAKAQVAARQTLLQQRAGRRDMSR